ncbi:MAG: DUF4352 domain-containing protein [Enterocloster asparagiformis]|nr:DUF4352 domain-containing protein [Enterocloster asparagiformis]
MSIKGSGGELFIGKQKATIITFWGNKIEIPYDDLKRIDYSYFKHGDGGYIEFVDITNQVRRFEFSKKANSPIFKAITFIQENKPVLDFVEHNSNELKFYERNFFILLMLFCCFPLGLFLMWHHKKNTMSNRIFLTFFFTMMWGFGIYIQYQNAVTTKNEFQQSYENIMQSIYDEGNQFVESISESAGYTDTTPGTFDESRTDSSEVSEYNVGDVFESNEIKIMFIDSGDYSTDNEFLQPASGNKYIYAEFSVYNIGESDYSVGSVSFDCYADDTLCSQAILTADDTMSSIATLSPNRNIKGKIYYEVPKDSNKIEIEFETDFLSQDKVYFIVK